MGVHKKLSEVSLFLLYVVSFITAALFTTYLGNAGYHVMTSSWFMLAVLLASWFAFWILWSYVFLVAKWIYEEIRFMLWFMSVFEP